MLEKMSDFFTARVGGYDNHMINNVSGCKEAYLKMAELLPGTVVNLLDLGCGTGLELDEIFKMHPNIKVIGIDLTKAMLDTLKQKHPNKDITLINASYFDSDFGIERFDAIISIQTMHHFPHDKKIKLYSRAYSALKPGGKYIECDYMVIEQKDEDFFFKENERIRKEQNIPDDEFYHFDTPCTVDNQLKMFRKANFQKVEMIWRIENTTIIVAEKAIK
ncbi:MAG: class I SAM-dependent methyltransferase [Lutisporaceae bacterium]